MQRRTHKVSRYHYRTHLHYQLGTPEVPTDLFIRRGFFFEKHWRRSFNFEQFRYDSNLRANKALYSLIVFKPEED